MIKNLISIINQKGGVGKTTTVINLSTALALSGKKVLIIDLDPQGNATTGLGVTNVDDNKTIYSALNRNINIANTIVNTQVKNLHLIPSNVNLAGLEVETADDKRRAFILDDLLKKNFETNLNKFSYIFVDCPPSLNLLTVSSLVAANSLLVPLQTEFFALEGVTQLMKTIDRIKDSLNRELKIRGILLTMFDKRNKLSSQVENEARDYFKEKVYQTIIPRNVRLSEAPSHGVPVLIYDKNCSGSKSYFNFANEFINQEKIMETAA